MFHIQPRTDESTTLIEEALQLSAEIGAEGAVLFGGALVVYVLIGAIAAAVLKTGAPNPFLSVGRDPVFPVTGTIVGIFTVQSAGSMLFHHFYAGIEDESIPSVVLSLVVLGVGAALVQMTLPETWRILVSHV